MNKNLLLSIVALINFKSKDNIFFWEYFTDSSSKNIESIKETKLSSLIEFIVENEFNVFDSNIELS
jgi:hypothetical protein